MAFLATLYWLLVAILTIHKCPRVGIWAETLSSVQMPRLCPASPPPPPPQQFNIDRCTIKQLPGEQSPSIFLVGDSVRRVLNNVNGTHLGGHQSLCLLNCLTSKHALKQGKVFEFLKLTAEPMLLENWKRPCKVMEFEKLKRVRTLSARPRVTLASINWRERVTV